MDLQRLELQANQLTGSIPADLGHLAALRSLDLSSNSFRDSIPKEIGDLIELRRLDLRQNQFAGRVPDKLGQLARLEELYLSHNQMTGSLPMSLVALNGLVDFQWDDSGLCAPEGEGFQAWATVDRTPCRRETCSSPLLLTVPAAHLTQAAQTLDGAVPLIAGRAALLRVFGHRRPRERIPARRPCDLLRHDREIASGGHESGIAIGDSRNRGPRQPGSILPRDCSRGSAGTRSGNGGGNRPRQYPATSSREPDARAGTWADGTRRKGSARHEADGWYHTSWKKTPNNTVIGWASALGPDHDAIRLLSNILPVVGSGCHGTRTYVTDVDPTSFRAWTDLLQDITLLRLMDKADGYYYGAVARPRGTGITGLAYVSKPRRRRFAGCRSHGARTGSQHEPASRSLWSVVRPRPRLSLSRWQDRVWGYDFRSERLVPPSTADLMGYCEPAWISDYHFAKALQHRLSAEEATSRVATAANTNVLLLWGSVSPEGELRLNPAFALDAAARPPSGGGPYRLEGLAANGVREFSLDFALDQTGEGGGGFLFTIPFENERLASLERIVLSGTGREDELTTASNRAMAIVLDRETGRLRSVLRGQDANAAAASVSAEAAGPGRAEPGPEPC